jgi:hypothetical protein
MTQTLPREHPNFDFGLVEPTPMGGCVVDAKPVPDFGAKLSAVKIGQRLAAMNIEIVQHQVDGLGLRVLEDDFEDCLGEFRGRTIRRREGEMAAGFGFYRAENIGSPLTPVFVIPPGFSSRLSRRGWPLGQRVR